MGFGNGAFQAARISIDGVTIIQEITTGQVTAAQGSIGMMPSIPADTYANGSIASGFSEYVLTSATSFSINGSASWNLPATYGTILDSIYSSDYIFGPPTTFIVAHTASNYASGAITTITNALTVGSGDIVIVFLTLSDYNGTSSPISPSTVSITDSLGNVYVLRASTVIPGTQSSVPNLVMEFASTTGNAGSATITANFPHPAGSADATVYMQSLDISSNGASGPYFNTAYPPSTTTNSVATLLGYTSLLQENNGQGLQVGTTFALVIAYFGLSAGQATYIADGGNATGVYGIPITTASPSDGNVLTYQSSSNTVIWGSGVAAIQSYAVFNIPNSEFTNGVTTSGIVYNGAVILGQVTVGCTVMIDSLIVGFNVTAVTLPSNISVYILLRDATAQAGATYAQANAALSNYVGPAAGASFSAPGGQLTNFAGQAWLDGNDTWPTVLVGANDSYGNTINSGDTLVYDFLINCTNLIVNQTLTVTAGFDYHTVGAVI